MPEPPPSWKSFCWLQPPWTYSSQCTQNRPEAQSWPGFNLFQNRFWASSTLKCSLLSSEKNCSTAVSSGGCVHKHHYLWCQLAPGSTFTLASYMGLTQIKSVKQFEDKNSSNLWLNLFWNWHLQTYKTKAEIVWICSAQKLNDKIKSLSKTSQIIRNWENYHYEILFYNNKVLFTI